MSVEAPDPKSFKTWDEAFQYPIPAVRRMEQQLRGDLTANRDRLRTLVGASYRELLGTAEKIIQMDEDMQGVEKQLGSISRRCNSRMVEKVGNNFRTWNSTAKTEDHERYAFASQLSILQSCPLVISRLLRQGGSVLIATKVLVLSRHLHKALSLMEGAPPVLDKLRNRLSFLRSKLLRHIDRQLSSPSPTPSVLVDTICAYSLATSSTPTDVLRHFHHVRAEAIFAQLENRHDTVLKALRLYARTLHDTRSIFPHSLGEALLKLRSQPLRKDPSLRALTELNIDIHEEWISTDVKNFIPWIRHDDLSRQQSDRLVESWAAKTFASLVKRLRALLNNVEDFPALILLRTQILQMWFSAQKDVAGSTASDPVQELRTVINDQLVRLIRGRASRLRSVCAEIIETFESSKRDGEMSTESLWAISPASADLANGAVLFKQAVLDRLHGKSSDLRQVIVSYYEWLDLMDQVSVMIRELRNQSWDDDLEDEEDESGLEARNVQLSEDDPNMLEGELDSAITSTFGKFENALEEQIEEKASGLDSSQTVYVLRVLREIRQKLPQHGSTDDFGLALVPALHEDLAKMASSRVLGTYERGMKELVRTRKSPSRGLWEGSPPLPVLPSPLLFKFLHSLATDATEYGSDVWSPSATNVLRRTIRVNLERAFQDLLSTHQNGKLVNGSSATDKELSSELGNEDRNGHPKEVDHKAQDRSESSLERENLMQLLFDIMVIRNAFDAPDLREERHGLEEIEATLTAKVQMGELTSRLRKGAQDYWKRTSLLFELFSFR
ncbi:MAG: hypothetical protein M4579_005371 [Chaenotheca gracillima]|nr:MAG: hypothetical protein M4579_005371 [Chaenotheca gracillima]